LPRNTDASSSFVVPRRPIAEWVVLFAALVVWRRDCLDSPPTPDQGPRGIWFEAAFLARTDFDYHRLRFEEQGPVQGGASIYVTSALPTLLAVLMRTLPTPGATILVYHLATLACAAYVLWTVFDWVRRGVGVGAGLLAMLLVASTPQFSLQMELLGMDAPLAAISTACANLIVAERWASTAAATTLASLVKPPPPGSLMSCTAITYLAMVLLFGGRDADQRRSLRRGLWLNGLALALQIFILFAGGMDHLSRRPVRYP
jgi:hypothetical protein